jgi:hypothetical protein
MPATVVDSGTYTFEVDSGFDYGSFRLDDATKGVLDNTTYKLGPNTSYVDLSQYVKQITYRRGRRRTVDQFGAGTMTVIVDDQLAGGILNPLDDGSPYYDTTDDYFGLEPGRRVRLSRQVSGSPEYLFIGTIVTYDYKYELAGNDAVSIQCADDFYLLAQAILDEWNVTAEMTGARLNSLLDLPEVDLFDPIERDISIGTVNLGHASAYTVPAGTNALAYAQQIEQTAEYGRLFMSRDGVFTATDRIGNTLSAPTVTFSNDGIETPYNDLSIDFDGSDVTNRVVVTALDGDTATATDTASVVDYGYRTFRVDNSLLHETAEISAFSTYLLEPFPEPLFTSVQSSFLACTTGQRDDLTVLDIGDTVEITALIPGQNTNTTQESAVEGIEATIDFRRGHTVRIYTSPTTIVYLLQLDDAIYGVLDADNVLG